MGYGSVFHPVRFGSLCAPTEQRYVQEGHCRTGTHCWRLWIACTSEDRLAIRTTKKQPLAQEQEVALFYAVLHARQMGVENQELIPGFYTSGNPAIISAKLAA